MLYNLTLSASISNINFSQLSSEYFCSSKNEKTLEKNAKENYFLAPTQVLHKFIKKNVKGKKDRRSFIKRLYISIPIHIGGRDG